MQNTASKRPLSSIRVVDFGQYLAGPLVGMMLADLGAEVIRIDPPGGPRLQEACGEMFARGKRALTLDLKNNDDRHTAIELIKRSDILVENFRPGVMHRLGLDYATLCKLNNQLIYLSLPGFASTDIKLADIPAWESVIAAFTGQFTDMGLNRRLMGINPSYTPLALASAYGACFGAMSVLFALRARDTNGGDHIEVPLASALLEGLVYNCEQIEDYPERYKSPREKEIERRNAAGLPMNLSHAELSEFLDPFYRTYTCRDGRGFYVVAGSVASHPRRVLQVLGLEKLLAELPDFNAYLNTDEWPDSWTLRNYPVGEEMRDKISSAMKAAFLTRPAHEWDRLFGEAKAPATAQRFTHEWLHDKHAIDSGLILEVPSEQFGIMQQMGNVAWIADDAAALDKKPAPTCDINDHELHGILAEPVKPQTPQKSKQPWLKGLRVLDLTNVIAGPTIGSTLARFGATVDSIQPVEPSVDPWNTIVFGLHAHRGKRSLLLDLRTTTGKQILHDALSRYDIVTINATDEQRDKLGLNPEVLQQSHPELILVQLDAFGGPARGFKSDHLGYDDLAQAATGVMLRFGGGMETPEEHAHFGTIDVLTGYCACVSLAAALLQQRRTAKGTVARASLAAAGNLIQAQFMVDHEGRPPFDEPSGREVKGWGPFYHCYRASDGWLFLAAPTEQTDLFHRVEDLKPLIGCQENELVKGLTEIIGSKPLDYWKSQINSGSTTIIPLASLQQTRDEALQLASAGNVDIRQDTFRAIRHDDHPMGRWVDLVAPNAVRPTKAPITIPSPMPKYGEHSTELLRDWGYQEDTVRRWLHEGIVADSWSSKYLPE